jgi:hypothetical protein
MSFRKRQRGLEVKIAVMFANVIAIRKAGQHLKKSKMICQGFMGFVPRGHHVTTDLGQDMPTLTRIYIDLRRMNLCASLTNLQT